MKILIRADGDSRIGLGHIYRCLILAEAFQKQNYKVFILSHLNPTISALIPKEILIPISEREEDDVEKIAANIVILDNRVHQYDVEYDKKITNFYRTHTSFLVSLDDNTNTAFLSDICFNILYPLSKRANIIKSFKYTIINPKFIALKKQYKFRKKINKILIVQGGADTHCIIPRVIKVLNTLDTRLSLIVVTGAAFDHFEILSDVCQFSPHSIETHSNVKNIGEIFLECDLAITAAGMTLLELCCLGVPTITICAEKFEVITAKRLEKQGATVNLGYHKNISSHTLITVVQRIINDELSRKKIYFNSKKLIDGSGVEYMIEYIKKKYKQKLN